MERRLKGMPVFLGIILLSFSGCQSVGSINRTDTDALPPPPALVDIGGLVTKPQSLAIGPDGLTLLQAIARAGSIENEPASFLRTGKPSLRLIRLQRRSKSIVPTNFYFPATFVMSGMGGNVPLRAGDLVQVMDVRDSSLAFDQSVPAGQTYTVAGNVEKPGVYETKVGARFSQLKTNAGQLNASHLVLTRNAIGGLGLETYFIPFKDPAFTATLQNLRLLTGDTYLFQEFKSHPIILTSLVEPILRQRKTPIGKPAVSTTQRMTDRFFGRFQAIVRRQ